MTIQDLISFITQFSASGALPRERTAQGQLGYQNRALDQSGTQFDATLAAQKANDLWRQQFADKELGQSGSQFDATLGFQKDTANRGFDFNNMVESNKDSLARKTLLQNQNQFNSQLALERMLQESKIMSDFRKEQAGTETDRAMKQAEAENARVYGRPVSPLINSAMTYTNPYANIRR